MATQENIPMISETSICNQALSWLGEDPINSLDDQSTTAEWMRNNYPFLRDAVLEERMWRFALVRDMSETVEKDGWGQMYKHSIPHNWIQVFRVYKDVSGRSPNYWPKSDGWQKEGEFVLAKDPIVYMWGIQRITDTNKFSMLFTQALAARIAADAAIPLTENRALQGDMWRLYADKLSEATARDGMQGTVEKTKSDSLVVARGGVDSYG